MLNINQSTPSNGNWASYGYQSDSRSAEYINFGHMVLTANATQDAAPVALRCDLPLDAIELDSHGYQHVFYESNNRVCEETFICLDKLGINALAYFCDVSGPNFNVIVLEQYAKRFNIKLCSVVLPFFPSGMSLWDNTQWRIFDSRLSKAVGQISSCRGQRLKVNGRQCYATFH